MQLEGGGPVTSLAGFEDPPPLHRLVRGWGWASWIAAGLVVLRLLAVAGMRLYLYFDSAEYDRLDFSGDWRRPWATPYLYWLIPGTNRSLLIGQALIGAISWAVLALAAAAWFRLPAMRFAVAAAIAVLGCTTAVTNWDAAKLSESLGISLTVLVIAAWLNFLRRTDRVTAVWLVVATLPWLFVRQSLLSAAWLVVLAAAIGALIAWRRGHGSKLLGVVCLVLAIETAVASVTYSHNQEVVRENLTVIVANRVATDPARLEWFTDHGMPVPESGGLDFRSLKDDAAFTRWVAGEGRSTYVRYLASHPWYTATAPLDDLAGLRNAYVETDAEPSIAMLSPPDRYATVRTVLPAVVEDVLFGAGDSGGVIFALVVMAGWTLARTPRRSMRWTVPLLLIAISFASLYTGWHGATPELGRLGLLGAIGIRIGLLLQIAFLLEDEVLQRRARRSAAEPVPVGEPAISS
jgi:hypothetical protein